MVALCVSIILWIRAHEVPDEGQERPRRRHDDGARGLAHRLDEVGRGRGRRGQEKGALRPVVWPGPLDRRGGLHRKLARRHNHKQLARLGHVQSLQQGQQVGKRLAGPGRRVYHRTLAAPQRHHRRLLDGGRLGHASIAQRDGRRRLERQIAENGERRAQYSLLDQDRRTAALDSHGAAGREQCHCCVAGTHCRRILS